MIQATAVAPNAAGATNQKSCGDPNQQSGVIIAAQIKINLRKEYVKCLALWTMNIHILKLIPIKMRVFTGCSKRKEIKY